MTDGLQPAPPLAPALVYRNRPGLPGLVLRNLGLNLVTFWIYRFWAKTRWRRHIWSNVTLLGDPIEYTGTGPEMFKGFLVALAFLAPFFIVFGAWEAMVEGSGVGTAIEQIAYFTALYALIVAASFYARRYRLSRTRWRGVALVLDAKFGEYIKFRIRVLGRNIVTLFVTAPYRSLAVERWMIERTRFGAAGFAFDGNAMPLMNRWLAFWGLAVFFALQTGLEFLPEFVARNGWMRYLEAPGWLTVIAGIAAVLAYLAYRAALFRAILTGTTLGEMRFESGFRAATVVGNIVIGLLLIGLCTFAISFAVGFVLAFMRMPVLIAGTIGNVLGGLLAFGFVRDAWVVPWIFDHVVNSTTISNPEALAAIAAGTEDALTRGEGLADSFDVGIG